METIEKHKQNLIEAIKELNPLASDESLIELPIADLQEYLEHLMAVEGVLFCENNNI